MNDSQTPSDVERCLLDAGEVADLLKVTRGWVYEQSRRGRIPTVRLGRYCRYRREAIDEWVRDTELGSGAPSSTQGA